MTTNTATAENLLLRAALEYAGYGWRVVPLHWMPRLGVCSCYRGTKCPTPGKHPYGKDWQRAATVEEDKLTKFWEKHPTANVGIQMGQTSGIVDFESDDEEQEKLFLDLFGQDPPVTSCFISHRGKHRLFAWRPDLPGGAIVKIGSLVARIGNGDLGAMSVFPPSAHPSGSIYQWTNSPDDCPPQQIPDTVMAKLWNWMGVDDPTKVDGEKRPREHWDKILDGVDEGSRDSSMISYIGKLLRTATDLGDESSIHVIYKSVQAVNQRNRPPLSEEALKKDFLSILKAEQNRRLTDDVESVLKHKPEDQVGKHKPLGQMKLVIVHSDPPRYRLFAPQFSKAEGGFLILDAKQMNNGSAIKVQALEQAEYPLPAAFSKAWKAKDGLYERLVFNAEHEEAPIEDRRHLVVAQRLRNLISKPRIVEEGQLLDKRGRPMKLPDGSIVFLFTTVWEELNMSADKVLRSELSAVLKKIGAEWHVTGEADKLKKLDKETLRRLDILLRS